MDKKKICALLSFLLGVLVALGVSLAVFNHFGLEGNRSLIDTTRVTVVDTVCYLQPVPVDSVVLTYKTVTLAKADKAEPKIRADTQRVEHYLHGVSLIEQDSVKVVIPISQKMYKANDYTAWVSGYEARLDSVYVYPKHEYVTYKEKQPPKRWHVGITAGYGLCSLGMRPFVGVGLTYSLLSF